MLNRTLNTESASSCLTLKVRCGWSRRVRITSPPRIISIISWDPCSQIFQHNSSLDMTATWRIMLSDDVRGMSTSDVRSTRNKGSEVAASNSTWTKGKEYFLDNLDKALFYSMFWSQSPLARCKDFSFRNLSLHFDKSLAEILLTW